MDKEIISTKIVTDMEEIEAVMGRPHVTMAKSLAIIAITYRCCWSCLPPAGFNAIANTSKS